MVEGVVEAVVTKVGPLLELGVQGRTIKVTAEHPFWVRGRGWLMAKELLPGDLLRSHDGRWVALHFLRDAGEVATVYNLSVADYHTYFVGDAAWGWSVWSHNTKRCGDAAEATISKRTGIGRNIGLGQQRIPGTGRGGYRVPDLKPNGPDGSLAKRGSIMEVKDRKRVSSSPQIRDNVAVARAWKKIVELMPKTGDIARWIKEGILKPRRLWK